ncbi:hypothetical protein, partial [Nocardia sp. NPDC002869]|uniref:hypothetical protein n=1 Tax=Nocardia sp. NPDC002869 TaxID=3161032 RepID=UPI00398CC7E3
FECKDFTMRGTEIDPFTEFIDEILVLRRALSGGCGGHLRLPLGQGQVLATKSLLCGDNFSVRYRATVHASSG